MASHEIWCGDFAAAASLIAEAEAEAIAAATGSGLPRYAAVFLAGLRGTEGDAAPLIEAVITDSRAAGQGLGVQWSQWVSAILYNGLGRYEQALAEAQQAAEQAPELFISLWALAELIEAASRSGQSGLAAGALARLAETTSIGPSDWGLGIYARCRALLSDGADAETSYSEAIDRLRRTRFRPELARAHLLYGEWLRREHRRADARAQLRTAHEMFAAIGMQAFADRARRELRATGETARTRTAAAHGELTPQETQIARLADRACPTRRSPPSCSSARTRSNTTSRRSSPSSASPPAASSAKRHPAAAAPGRWHNRGAGMGLGRRVATHRLYRDR